MENRVSILQRVGGAGDGYHLSGRTIFPQRGGWHAGAGATVSTALSAPPVVKEVSTGRGGCNPMHTSLGAAGGLSALGCRVFYCVCDKPTLVVARGKSRRVPLCGGTSTTHKQVPHRFMLCMRLLCFRSYKTTGLISLSFSRAQILRRAVMGMLPKNSLRKRMVTKLLIYPGPSHPHDDQLPADSAQSLLERVDRALVDRRPADIKKYQDENYTEWP